MITTIQELTETYTTLESPVGELLATASDAGLSGLWFRSGGADGDLAPPPGERDERPFAALREQLGEYFAGERRSFDLELAPRGTEWEHRVWAELLRIPY